MEKYDHKKIEEKWQKYWSKHPDLCAADDNSKKEKKYVLDMFPYPSGEGLHVGHVESYTATDIISRYYRMNNKNVLHPQGWDAFGLPAENYAIKTKIHPLETTKKAIETFKGQMNRMGFSYDWSREVCSADPAYYKWTQWFFLLLYKNGLAYKKKAKVNWCESCQTVLANEQAEGGICERCKNQVIQKDLEQWFFKITDFIEDNGKTAGLISGLEKIDWPESTKSAQKNWIGKSEGINIEYKIDGTDKKITVYTTRPDTNFGATFIVMAPDCKFVKENIDLFPNKDDSKKYIEESLKKTELERISEGKKKTGSFTGLYAINELNNKKMPIYLSDFVLASVGTGVVVGVPGHDVRDFEFAEEFGIEIIRVVVGSDGDTSPIVKKEQVQEESGIMINSGFLDGLDIHDATEKIKDYIVEKGWGKKTINYKLRDWLVSRQRYWGAPIPIIYCDKCGEVAVPEKDLPVLLPDDVDFVPTGESPLQKSKKFHDVKCPVCGGKARRESDTMDTFVCSSWYYLRYSDPKNDKEFASPEMLKQWLPVDLYVGGAEHSVLHLLYARFFTKVLHKLGYVNFNEPFLKLRHQGIILAEDGRKMSKSFGNVINPDKVVGEFGADALRMFEMFMGPLEAMKPWNTKGIIGIVRFLEKVWKLQTMISEQGTVNNKIQTLLNKTIKKVTDDIENFRFNTAISQLMILVNALEKEKEILFTDYCSLITVLSPFAPHIAEEIWEKLGHKESIFKEKWPIADEKYLKEEEIEMVVQVNGKLRDRIFVAPDVTEDEAKETALESEKVGFFIGNSEIKKIVFVSGKLINIVI